MTLTFAGCRGEAYAPVTVVGRCCAESDLEGRCADRVGLWPLAMLTSPPIWLPCPRKAPRSSAVSSIWREGRGPATFELQNGLVVLWGTRRVFASLRIADRGASRADQLDGARDGQAHLQDRGTEKEPLFSPFLGHLLVRSDLMTRSVSG